MLGFLYFLSVIIIYFIILQCLTVRSVLPTAFSNYCILCYKKWENSFSFSFSYPSYSSQLLPIDAPQ